MLLRGMAERMCKGRGRPCTQKRGVTPVFRLVVTKKRQESAHVHDSPFKIPIKMCACADSRRFFCDNQPENRCTRKMCSKICTRINGGISVHPSSHLSVCLSMSVRLAICLSICLPLCLSVCPTCLLSAPSTQAIDEYNMIENGDRVMVCLSGGKDSLSLLHTLHQYQFMAKSKVNLSIGPYKPFPPLIP